LHEERIRAGIEKKPVKVLRDNDAAWLRLFLEKAEGQAPKMELIRRG
jgi:hypothetical protein